jgi:hypothetical protein
MAYFKIEFFHRCPHGVNKTFHVRQQLKLPDLQQGLDPDTNGIQVTTRDPFQTFIRNVLSLRHCLSTPLRLR